MTKGKVALQVTVKPRREPPYVGALLRICWRAARERLADAIHKAGFVDLQEPHLLVFSYPAPDGHRPSEIARRLGATRQAANYMIGQLEDLGYLERRTDGESGRRLVWLTDRGREVTRVMHVTLEALEAEWAEDVGADDFDAMMRALRRLAKVE
jgi:DNA-binding MarR family transcriptional regulator